MRRLILLSLLTLLLTEGCHKDPFAPEGDLANSQGPDLLNPNTPDFAGLPDMTTAPDAGLVLNEQLVTISGRVTVNGKTPTNFVNCLDHRGVISFTDPAHSATLFQTKIPCSVDDFSWSLRVAPGTYDVTVAFIASPDAFHYEYRAIPHLPVGSDVSDLVLDLPVRTLSGTVTFNGAVPIAGDGACQSFASLGIVSFRHKAGAYADLVEVGCNGPEFAWNIKLPVGHYEIFVVPTETGRAYGVSLLDAALPGYRVASDFVVDKDTTDIVLNEVGHAVSGTLLLNGQKPVTNGGSCVGRQPVAVLTFFDPFASQRFQYEIDCSNTEFAWSLPLPVGNYRVSVRPGPYANVFGIAMPNGDQVIGSALAIDGPKNNVVLDEVSFPVSGNVTVGGKTPIKKGAACDPSSALVVVRFHDLVADTSSYATIRCDTTDFSFSTLLPAGTYDVLVYAASFDVNVAGFEVKILSALTIDGPIETLTIDEVSALGQTYHVAGSILKNGAPPKAPTCATDDMIGADVVFFDKQTGSLKQISVPCKNNPTLSWSTTLPTGIYEVRVAGAYLPQYALELSTVRYVANPALLVNSDLSDVLLDQKVHEVSGVVQVNGAMPMLNDAACVGRKDVAKVIFEDSAQDYVGYTLVDCSTKDFSFSLPLPSGKYEVYVSAGYYAEPFQVDLVGNAVRVMSGFVVP